ncbi:putative leucine-rich repeat-containing protein DDB_G0290503 isoform X1 [Lucilia cuprina]|uniref:putative leucine-rich repeat-containing protein DDB_G0290503 isoform X1 n=1 Tax=Lucilia cuprina TaxID=7375 RepID=UPI001F069524|nr:putative leucine-rich repeat-containing protein DDB_G0290503 isoform X1 [Lucilia cuprina]
MHHLYPSLKGDQLCPLGFHPQTRYPTRCKRCFRDYKEHGGRRGADDVAASSPNLSDGFNSRPSSRTWTSTQNLSSINGSSNDIVVHFNVELKKRPQSWASTPDIDEVDDSARGSSRSGGKSTDDNNVDVTLKLPVPPRRHTTTLDIKEVENSLSQNSSASSSSKNIPDDLVILSTDSLAERVRKMNLLKKQRSQNSRESSRERSVPRKQEQENNDADAKPPPDRPERTKAIPTSNSSSSTTDATKHLSLPPKKTSSSNTSSSTSNHTRPTSAPVSETHSALPPTPPKTIPTKLKTTSSTSNTTTSPATSSSAARKKESERQKAAQDVQFMLNIKENSFNNKKQNLDNMSLTTETPYAGHQMDREHLEEMATLRKELEAMKARAEKAEREKSDILLRRLASMETAPNRTAASEAIMLQQKVNELKEQLEKITEEKRKLNTRMKELENNPKSAEHELRRKLQAAEQICEELMEENQEAKKEILNLQAEMDELQDTFRDDEVKAKTSLQKDLEKTTKNCRILSFKLKKCERKIETLEQERQNNGNLELNARIKQLEDELRFSQELTKKLQAEAEDLRNPGKKKAPMLGVLGKSTSADARFTRESLTRGGSQEDPQQLLRDLQDSVERESDLKDQLKFAEEEINKLKTHVTKSFINKGIQTQDNCEILKFPRSTQTDSVEEIPPVDIENNLEECGVFSNTNLKEDNIEMNDKCVQTESFIKLSESCDESTQTLDSIELKSSPKNNEDTINMPDIFMRCHKRENSPFAAILPSVSSRPSSSSVLFPSLISNALKSGAGAARKLSPTPHRLAPEVQAERDEGISDEDDPAELRILLELNEQEASILRHKVEELEKQNSESKKQVRELQDKLTTSADKRNTLGSWGNNASEKRLKALNDELEQLRKNISEKDKHIERLQAAAAAQTGANAKRQIDMAEQEATALRSKVTALEAENERVQKEVKRLQLQALRKQSSTEKNGNTVELAKLKENLASVEEERNNLQDKLKRIFQEAEEKLPPRTIVRITDLTPKNQLKKWVEELDDEISEMRAIVAKTGAHTIKSLESEKKTLEEELREYKTKLTQAETDLQKLKSTNTPKVQDLEKQLKKTEEESKQLNSKIKELEDKIKKQDNLIKKTETSKSSLEQQIKTEKEKLSKLEKDYEKERKEREKLEGKLTQKESELTQARKAADKTKTSLENEIKELKTKSSKSDTKQVQELKKQLEELHETLDHEAKRYNELNAQWEKMSEETILMRAQLSTEKNNLQTELNNAKQKISELETIRVNRSELAKKLNDAQKKIQELETKTLKNGHSEYEKTMLQNKLDEKIQEYERLRRENEMNIDLVFQLRKDNDELNRKLSDFNRIEQAQSSINGHSASLENEIKSLKIKLENSEMQLKSEVASTRLRYEQQVKTLSGELTSMHRQCERFKKDRDAFKQMLESAQKKIGDLKANNAGRQSRGSMHSSDEDDKSKIAYLEQQIGCLEDQLVEARLEASKVKTELVSERSANEIKISEMQSKLNEFEEERVIGSGRTKIPGMKTKLELSWQKEREDQQRLLQETSTLARDLRQTLFEVERERDKERLEAKRRQDQLKRTNEEEMEEGRRKIAELQCDLLELRDVHAKLRTSNEKLRRERERYEKELIKRRMEQEGGDRKLGALLHTVDELVKMAPDLMGGRVPATPNDLRPEPISPKRSRSPSPSMNTSHIGSVLARLAEASEELRKFQRINEEEHERNRMRRGNLRRAASQENDPHGSQSSVASASGSHRNGSKLSRSGHNGSLIRKSLSLDHSIQQDQNIWRQDDGSISSMQSIDSELGGMVRDSSYDSRLDSRLSGGSTQSDIPRGPRKKKKGLMGKLRSLTKSGRNSESEISIQGSDSDISVASDMRASKKDLRGRLSGMFKRSGSTSRSGSTERMSSEQRPVAVVVVGDADGPQPRDPPPANAMTPKPIRSISKPPTPTTPVTRRRVAKQ